MSISHTRFILVLCLFVAWNFSPWKMSRVRTSVHGYGYCVWWRVVSPEWNYLSAKVAQRLDLPQLNPHITIRCQIDNLVSFTKDNFVIFPKQIEYHTFPKKIHRTSQVVSKWKQPFHAIEIPVQIQGHDGAHISVAYRFGRPFSDKELHDVFIILSRLRGNWSRIRSDEIVTQLFNVTSASIRDWNPLSEAHRPCWNLKYANRLNCGSDHGTSIFNEDSISTSRYSLLA